MKRTLTFIVALLLTFNGFHTLTSLATNTDADIKGNVLTENSLVTDFDIIRENLNAFFKKINIKARAVEPSEMPEAVANEYVLVICGEEEIVEYNSSVGFSGDVIITFLQENNIDVDCVRFLTVDMEHEDSELNQIIMQLFYYIEANDIPASVYLNTDNIVTVEYSYKTPNVQDIISTFLKENHIDSSMVAFSIDEASIEDTSTTLERVTITDIETIRELLSDYIKKKNIPAWIFPNGEPFDANGELSDEWITVGYNYHDEDVPDLITSFLTERKINPNLVHFSIDETSPVKGDVNGDGIIDILDVIKVNKFILGSISLTSTQSDAADVNLDEAVDATDSLMILKEIVEITKNFVEQ